MVAAGDSTGLRIHSIALFRRLRVAMRGTGAGCAARRLRMHARRTNRRLADLAREVTDGADTSTILDQDAK
jgi:hypothetical protein